MKDVNSSGRSAGDGLYSEYDFSLTELKLINCLGVNIDVDFVFQEINLYEDLFNNVISGDATLVDSNDLLNRLKMHGNEFISVAFSTPGMQRYQKVFRIYKISDYTLRGTSNATFKLHFCSEEFMLNQQYYISKSFKESRLSDIIKIISRNFLKISPEKLTDDNIEQSSLLINPEKSPLIVPNLRPFEAINWIASFAINPKDLSPGYMFYENINGFNFVSLSSLYSRPAKKTIYYSPKNQNFLESIGSRHDKLDEMEFKQVFDVLDSMNNGAYASELLKLDIMNRTTEYEQFGVNQSSLKLLNEYLPYSYAKNRMGNSLNQASGYVRMFPKFQDMLTSKWLLSRAARIALLNNTRLHVDLPGDSSLSVGDIVNVSLPKNDAQTDPNNIKEDNMMSGRYLITGIRHQLIENYYYCHAELCKDSVNVNIGFNPQFNSAWNLVINS
jgi:hypothetical protein